MKGGGGISVDQKTKRPQNFRVKRLKRLRKANIETTRKVIDFKVRINVEILALL